MTTVQSADHPDNTSVIASNVKLSEARTAVLLEKNVPLNNRSELTMWFLEHMFQPVTTAQEYDGYQLIHLSASSKPCWERKKKETCQTQTNTGANDSTAVNIETANPAIVIPTICLPEKENKAPEKMYLITPRTRILTLSKEHCMVFMIDLSSSLATIETSTGKVMLGNAFSVLENIIQGLVQPYTIHLSENLPSYTVETDIRITVIAECSQFGSNINVIPILAEYPTLRVLMQNISVSSSNVQDVLCSLRESIDNFKRDLSKFRKQLRSKRAKMGYELDVREDHTQSVTEGVEPTFTRSSLRPKADNKATTASKGENVAPSSSSNATAQTQAQGQGHRRNRSVNSKQPFKKLEISSSSSSPKKSLTSSPASQHRYHKRSPSFNNSNSTAAINSTSVSQTNRPVLKEKKDTWGVGKSGSTLSYILRAGLLALSVLSKDEQASIFLLTDGVVKSNVQDETVIRQLTAENIWCNVIQLGQDKAFFPGLNFGFVPDNEILEFLANSTLGHFTFAEHCPVIASSAANTDIDCNDRPPPNVYHQRYLFKEVCLDYLNHVRMNRKLRETRSSGQSHPHAKELADVNNTIALTSMPFDAVPHYDRRAFPWDPLAKPVLEELGRLKFKEYFLPTECWHFMRARLRQGFILQSISFIDEPKASHNNNKAVNNNGIQRQQTLSTEGFPHLQKKQYVIMIFILRWQPNITVQYSIKALWTSSLRYHLKFLSAGQENPVSLPLDAPPTVESEQFFQCIRNPKVEIVIKSTSTFAHMLHNWDAFQRRTQMMAVQGGSATVDLASAPGFIKVGKMKRFLERLAETDGMLKQLVQFSITEKSSAASSQQQLDSKQDSNVNSEWQQHSTYIQKFSSHWAKFERSDLRLFNSCWYDEKGFNIILTETSASTLLYRPDAYTHGESELSSSLAVATNINRAAIQTAFNQVQSNLRGWATFISEDQQVYIKVTNIDQLAAIRKDAVNDGDQASTDKHTYDIPLAPSSSPKRHLVPQFFEVRLMRETERLLYVKLMFFNLGLSQRKELEEEVERLIVSSVSLSTAQEETIRSQDTSPALVVSPVYGNDYSNVVDVSLNVTKRPLSTLLMRDAPHHAAFAVTDIDAARSPPPPGIRSLWISNPAMLLTGEFIVKNYLQHCTWHWDVQDIQHDQYGYGQTFTPMMDLAFDHIVVARLKENWSLLSISKSSAHFYTEATDMDGDTSPAYSAQYFIWKNAQKKRLTTELWIEPTSDEKTYRMHEVVKKRTFAADKRIISQLITFDIIYLFGQNHSAVIDDILAVRMEDEDETRVSTVWMHRSMLFDLFSIIQIGCYLFAVYRCPNFDRHFHPEAAKPVGDKDHFDNHRRGILAGEVIRQRNELVFGTSELQHHSRVTFDSNTDSSSGLVKPPAIYQTDMSATCACPRPDRLFSSRKEYISKLSPMLRDMALLHYYVEKSLSLITDRTMPLTKVPMDDFWASLVKELLHNTHMNANDSATSIMQNFRDYHCFIKVFDPSVFMVVLCPQLKTVVKELSKVDKSSDSCNLNGNSLVSKMGLLVFECQRQNTIGRFNDPLKVDQIRITPMERVELGSTSEGASLSLQPEIMAGSFSAHQSKDNISEQSMHLMRDITNIYSRCYVKSIFSCLLHGRAVDSEDFQQVLEVCNETNIDIDLTGYLNVQTMLRRQSSIKEEDFSEVYQRFTAVLGHFFEPVIIADGKWSNIYCYRPPFAKIGQKLGLSLSSGEKPTELADVVMCAQSPLFVRLNCTLRKPDSSEKDGYAEIQFPLHRLPMSFKGTLEDGTEYDFEPESIGTDVSPVESTDKTTATLHLVCITLPPCEYDVVSTDFSHEPTCPMDLSTQHQDFPLNMSKDKQARIQGLSKDKLDALLETEARLNWLFTEEIMHGLLRIDPVTESMIHYVEAQLQKKNPFVDFPTTAFIPLAFVKGQRESRQIFLDELETYNNTSYKLERAGDCFYASDSVEAIVDDGDNADVSMRASSKNVPFFDGEGLNITTDPACDKDCATDTEAIDIKEARNDEFCQGLGISIEQEAANDSALLAANSSDQPIRPRRYWLLIIPQAQTVKVYFYAKKQQFVNRTEIIRVTRSMINDVLERTNKMSLLRYLNETRKCSKYLLATAEEESSIYSSEEESTEEDEYINNANSNLVEILSTSGEDSAFSPPKKFLPGQFTCDIVFTKRFPLHWRLAPNTAYNKLMADILKPFLVKNVPGMFVCSHDDSVLYCFLTEVSLPMHTTMSESTNLSLSVTSLGDDRYNATHLDSPFAISGNSNNESEMLSTTHSRARHTAPVTGKPSPQGSTHSDRHSPRHSPNPIPDKTTAASVSSPISNKKINQRNQEGRELILEVHGVKMNHYIIDGLVDMIESRITSDITLKEVQQFLVRNPNSKLSRADVDFILPVEKKPIIQRQLQLPTLIKNTAQFLKILRRNILVTSSLHSLQSSYLDDAVKRHYTLRYSKADEGQNHRVLEEPDTERITEEWSYEELCFYYNLFNRAPGTSLPFEQKIGEGIAGICLSVIDNEGCAYSRLSSSSQNDWRDYDTQSLRSCLTTDFEQTDSSDNVKIAVDIWTHCKIDVGQIYRYIYRSFKQTICDYIIETCIMSITNSDSSAEDEFANMVNVLTFTLKIAAEWESSTVKHILQPITLAPWYLEGITLQLKAELVDIHVSLEPVIATAKQNSTLNFDANDEIGFDSYEVYSFNERNTKAVANQKSLQPKFNSRRSTQNYPNTRTALLSQYVKNRKRLMNVPTFDNVNHKFLLLSGLPELLHRYNIYSSGSVRNGSLDANIDLNDRLSVLQGAQQNVHGITGQNNTTKSSENAKDDSGSLHSRQESLTSSISRALPSHVSKQKTVSLREPLHQHSFVIFLIDSHKLCTFAYNCSNQFIDFVYQAMCKNVMQQESRHKGLSNILNQKMGLFYHSNKLADVISQYQEEANDLPPPTVSSFAPATPLIQNSASQIHLLNNSSSRTPMSPIIANTFDRLVQLDSSSSVPSFDSMSNDKKSKKDACDTFGFEQLQQLITDNFQYKRRAQNMQHPSVLDIHDNAKLCRTNESDKVISAVKGADANTLLHDVFADSVEENTNWYDSDYLIRHGEPYLKMYLARSKPLAAHEKAFKVYMKWAHKYYGPTSQPSANNNEMMTVSELRQILKASRLLHFCRTPLIFSSLDSAITLTIAEPTFTTQLETTGGSTAREKTSIPKSEEMTKWYESLADSFLKEYAAYLESIGMHLIVYGPSNKDEDEVNAYLSNFTITEDYAVKSPVVYLLQVFEGGSIMCEIRLTGAFVSVTLYTLHRRYGRLQYSPFSYPQKREEIGRENFQLFMSESDRFKHRIHVNSFVYDFHLRYIQRSLDDIDMLPQNLDLLGILKSTVAIYNRPAIFARNRIMSGSYVFEVPEALVDIVPWIMRSGSVLGLKTLQLDGTPVSCFISSNSLSFDCTDDETSDALFRYTLILCANDDKSDSQSSDMADTYQQGSFDMKGNLIPQESISHIESIKKDGVNSSNTTKIYLKYFNLVTYRGMERGSCHKTWATVLREKPATRTSRASSDGIPTPDTTAVKEAARKRIENIIFKAMYYYHREMDWNKLCEVMRPHQLKESAETIVRVATRFSPTLLGDVDNSFRKFLDLKGVNWDDALDNLKLFFMMTSGEVSIGDTRHVFLFNVHAMNPTFFHFTYARNGQCSVTFNRKQDREGSVGFTEEERQSVINLAACLSYYLWRRLK